MCLGKKYFSLDSLLTASCQPDSVLTARGCSPSAVMLLLISVMQHGSSMWEPATVATASIVTTASMAMMLCGTVTHVPLWMHQLHPEMECENQSSRALDTKYSNVLVERSSSQANHRRSDRLHSMLCRTRGMVLGIHSECHEHSNSSFQSSMAEPLARNSQLCCVEGFEERG